MVIWHPNVAVGDLAYRERKVNQQVLQFEKVENTTAQHVFIITTVYDAVRIINSHCCLHR